MKSLKGLREAKKVSQQKLALELNLSQASISKYEIGVAEPDLKTIVKIANYFDVTTDFLLGNSEIKNTISKGDLSDDELEVVNCYRKLNNIQKQKVAAYLKGISEQ